MNANSNNTAILSCSPSVKQEEKRFNWMLSRKNVTPWISCKLHLQSVIIIQAVDFLQHSDFRPRYFTETLNVPHYLHSYVLISVEQTHNMQRCIWGLKLIWTSECWKQKKTFNLKALEIPINSKDFSACVLTSLCLYTSLLFQMLLLPVQRQLHLERTDRYLFGSPVQSRAEHF